MQERQKAMTFKRPPERGLKAQRAPPAHTAQSTECRASRATMPGGSASVRAALRGGVGRVNATVPVRAEQVSCRAPYRPGQREHMRSSSRVGYHIRQSFFASRICRGSSLKLILWRHFFRQDLNWYHRLSRTGPFCSRTVSLSNPTGQSFEYHTVSAIFQQTHQFQMHDLCLLFTWSRDSPPRSLRSRLLLSRLVLLCRMAAAATARQSLQA